jgi:hypothetical protein
MTADFRAEMPWETGLILQVAMVNPWVNPTPALNRFEHAHLPSLFLRAHFPTPPPQPKVSRAGSERRRISGVVCISSDQRAWGEEVEGDDLGRTRRQ